MNVKERQREKFALIFEMARRDGNAAATARTPVPMVVSQHSNPLDDNSPVERAWYVSEGACGFAWITLRDRKARNFATKHLNGWRDGRYWVHEYGQSVERKEAFAHAFAQTLNTHGIRAYAESRLD